MIRIDPDKVTPLNDEPSSRTWLGTPHAPTRQGGSAPDGARPSRLFGLQVQSVDTHCTGIRQVETELTLETELTFATELTLETSLTLEELTAAAVAHGSG